MTSCGTCTLYRGCEEREVLRDWVDSIAWNTGAIKVVEAMYAVVAKYCPDYEYYRDQKKEVSPK